MAKYQPHHVSRCAQQWFYIMDQQRAALLRDELPEQKEQYELRGADPLHRIATTNKSCLILEEDLGSVDHLGHPSPCSGILTTLKETNKKDDNPSGATCVRTECQVIVSRVSENDCVIYNKFDELAVSLRSSDLALRCQKTYDFDSKEFKELQESVMQSMRSLVMDAIAEDPGFAQAMKISGDENKWGFLVNWFKDDYIGTKLQHDQLWIVD